MDNKGFGQDSNAPSALTAGEQSPQVADCKDEKAGDERPSDSPLDANLSVRFEPSRSHLFAPARVGANNLSA